MFACMLPCLLTCSSVLTLFFAPMAPSQSSRRSTLFSALVLSTAFWRLASTAVLALGRSGFRLLWRLAALARCHSGARSACIFLDPSRGVWCSIFILFFVITSLGCSHVYSSVCLSLLHLVTSCPPLLGGYGALTRGVYQHLTLNGIYIKTNQTKTNNLFFRPLSMPFATLQRCRHRRCCPLVDNA